MEIVTSKAQVIEDEDGHYEFVDLESDLTQEEACGNEYDCQVKAARNEHNQSAVTHYLTIIII